MNPRPFLETCHAFGSDGSEEESIASRLNHLHEKKIAKEVYSEALRQIASMRAWFATQRGCPARFERVDRARGSNGSFGGWDGRGFDSRMAAMTFATTPGRWRWTPTSARDRPVECHVGAIVAAAS